MRRETLFVNPCWGWFNQEAEQVLALENGRDLEKRWDLERGIRLLSNVWGRIFRKKEKLVMVSGTSKWMD